MTITKIRARLERLEVSAKVTEAKVEEKKLPFGFPIDPAVVQAIKDEYEFLQHAGISRYFVFGFKDFNTPDEIQTRARIAALASTINCPPSYGFKEYWTDHERRLKLYPAEERLSALESAQARARMEAYIQSPEGKGRLRLDYLENGPGLLGPAHYEEMERLIKLYPEPWCQPEVSGLVEYFLRLRGTPKDRKLRFEKHQRWIKEREERHRRVKPIKGPLATDPWVKRYSEALRKNGCPTF